MIHLGDVIRAYREETGLTQSELSERSEVHSVLISRIERTGNLSLPNLDKLATGLGLHSWELLKVRDDYNERTNNDDA